MSSLPSGERTGHGLLGSWINRMISTVRGLRGVLMDSGEPKSREYNFLSDVSMLLPIYVVYLFLSGWAFNDYYFRFFSLDPRFLDVSFHDTLLRAFTLMFTTADWTLWFIYGSLFLVPPLVNRTALHFAWKIVSLSMFFVALLLWIYFVSRSAGEQKARTDKGDMSTLPAITFNLQKQSLVGKLLYMKRELYFVDRVRSQGDEKPGQLQLSVYKASEIENVKIVE